MFMIGEDSLFTQRLILERGYFMDVADMTARIHSMLDYGVFMDPLLVYTHFRDERDAIYVLAQERVDDLYNQYVHLEQFNAALEDFPFSARLMRMCIRETLLSTAITLRYERNGSLHPQPEDVIEASSKVDTLIRDFGIADMYKIYFVVAGYDVEQPLHFYRTVTETEFLGGIRHHPYGGDALDVFLMVGIARRSLRLKVVGKQRVIQLTRLGQERFLWMRRVLEESGYYAKRITLSYVNQFDALDDWDNMCDVVWPDAKRIRRNFVDWVNVSPGSRVLEVGCGTGTLTFDSDLYKAVGPQGKLIAIDVSEGMLGLAKRKAEQHGNPEQVQFQLASVEHLPFPDSSFEAVFGSTLLHSTDVKCAIAEMTRIVVPGGAVSILQGLHFSLGRPFFRDWFDLIYEIAGQRNAAQPQTYLPDLATTKGWFADAGLENIEVKSISMEWIFDDPEIVVQHLVRGLSLFQTELMTLPWDYQRTLIHELIDRGRDVCRKYPLADRIIDIPCIFIKGRRPY